MPRAVHSTDRRVEQGAASRRRIVQVATKLIANGSFASTSISAIVARSGLPATSIYWHFGSKEGLLAAVVEEGARHWFETIPRVDRLSGSPEQRLTELLDRSAEALATRPLFLRLLLSLALELKDTDTEALATIRRVRGEAIERLREALEPVVAATDPSAARRRALALARFTLSFVDGAFLGTLVDQAHAELGPSFDQLKVALLALVNVRRRTQRRSHDIRR